MIIRFKIVLVNSLGDSRVEDIVIEWAENISEAWREAVEMALEDYPGYTPIAISSGSEA